MRKLIVILFAAVMLTSCTVNKALVRTKNVICDVKAYAAADLKVENQMIQYTYIPSKFEGKTLSESQLVANAIFKAIENRDYDTMVQVRYYISIKYGLFGKKVTRVDICGFPAKYVDFRTPGEADRENAKAYDGAGIVPCGEAKTSFFRR